MSNAKSAGHERQEQEAITRVAKALESLNAPQAAAVSKQLDMIPALPQTDTRIYELAEAIERTRSIELDDSDIYYLLLVIGDSDWFDRLPSTLRPEALDLVNGWRTTYGSQVDHLLHLDEFPDDWSRFSVSTLQVSNERSGSAEWRILLEMYKYRGERLAVEMTPDSFIEFVNGLLEEIPTLNDEVRKDIEEVDWQELARLSAAAARSIISRRTSQTR